MKNLKTIVLALVLAAGISIVPVAGSSSMHVYYDVQPMTAEELAFAEANCPFSEKYLGGSQQSTHANPLPSDSAIEFNSAAYEAREFIEIWQSIKPITDKDLAIADAKCLFTKEDLISCLPAVQPMPSKITTPVMPSKEQVFGSHVPKPYNNVGG